MHIVANNENISDTSEKPKSTTSFGKADKVTKPQKEKSKKGAPMVKKNKEQSGLILHQEMLVSEPNLVAKSGC